MKTIPDPMSIKDATLPAEAEPTEDVIAWQIKTLKERQKAADEGRFASPEAVKAIVRKFIPNG